MKDVSPRRGTGDSYASRRDRHVHKPSGTSRQDSNSQRSRTSKGSDGIVGDMNLADDVKFNRSRNTDGEFGSVKFGDRAPITVGYVGMRADGVTKDHPEPRHRSRSSERR
ncbi:hypothetical protein EGW08_017562, partial [Elysia chlorotica]